jgi:hypothetical protein
LNRSVNYDTQPKYMATGIAANTDEITTLNASPNNAIPFL